MVKTAECLGALCFFFYLIFLFMAVKMMLITNAKIDTITKGKMDDVFLNVTGRKLTGGDEK